MLFGPCYTYIMDRTTQLYNMESIFAITHTYTPSNVIECAYIRMDVFDCLPRSCANWPLDENCVRQEIIFALSIYGTVCWHSMRMKSNGRPKEMKSEWKAYRGKVICRTNRKTFPIAYARFNLNDEYMCNKQFSRISCDWQIEYMSKASFICCCNNKSMENSSIKRKTFNILCAASFD